ncbi:MAG: DUF3800 domain-containing protein [bacterium]|nr:DUF3800 domain-containing protein [bacterium]
MPELINIYCDESCHQERDHHGVMLLGATWCRQDKVRQAAERLREIKVAHGMSPYFEAKWTKVSPAKVALYRDLIDYYFDDDDLHARVLIVPDKSMLNHEAFAQTHDEWYYKMYFQLLEVIIDPKSTYHVYLDIKDTLGAEKVRKLHEVLANANYDFSRKIVQRIQTVRSHEVELLQLTDLLMGAVGYANRDLASSPAKQNLVSRVVQRSGYNLRTTTLYQESKLSIFKWQAKRLG